MLPFKIDMRHAQSEEETELVKEKDPVSIEDLDKTIKLINLADEVDCCFTLCLELTIGEFSVSNDNYREIKLVQSKKEPDQLMISHFNELLSMNSSIEVKDIVGITFKLEFTNDES